MADRVVRLVVEVEVDGRKCGTQCRMLVHEDDRGNEPFCAAFGSVRRLKGDWWRTFRNPDCIKAERNR